MDTFSMNKTGALSPVPTTDSEATLKSAEQTLPPPDRGPSAENSSSASISEPEQIDDIQLRHPSNAPDNNQVAIVTNTEHQSVGSQDDYFALIVRDGLDLPIAGLELFVTFPSGKMCAATTSELGAISVPTLTEQTGAAKIEVADITGKRQQICELDLSKCRKAVIVRSPKVKVAMPLRPHQQTPPPPRPISQPQKRTSDATKTPSSNVQTPKKEPVTAAGGPWWQLNGAVDRAWGWLKTSVGVHDSPPTSLPDKPEVQKTLSTAGQPVTIAAGPECPNREGLRLGQYNNQFRAAIVEAAKRLGLIPQALCALIDCEAGKIPVKIPRLSSDGKPLKDKNGKPLVTKVGEQWNANAGNPQSGAAGLTQFLASTWLAHVLLPGHYIHEQSIAKGWVRLETRKNGEKYWAFVLSDKDKTATTTPYAHRSTDANVQASRVRHFSTKKDVFYPLDNVAMRVCGVFLPKCLWWHVLPR